MYLHGNSEEQQVKNKIKMIPVINFQSLFKYLHSHNKDSSADMRVHWFNQEEWIRWLTVALT